MNSRKKHNIFRFMLLFCLATGLFLPVAIVQGIPFPWTVSNLDPAGSGTMAVDHNGDVLETPFMVQLIRDYAGDGPDIPDIETGYPSGDDSLVFSWISDPDGISLPPGGFEFFATEDDQAVDSLNLYVRIFEGTETLPGSYYTNSEIFPGPNPPSLVQTVVRLDEQMLDIVGNTRPVTVIAPSAVEIPAGEELRITFNSVDDGDFVSYWFDSANLPGGGEEFYVTRTSPVSVEVSWIIPFDALGEIDLTGTVSDDFYDVPFSLHLTILPPTENPLAFHLSSPQHGGVLWQSKGVSWYPSHDIHAQAIYYSVLWSTDPEFTQTDSITDLRETTILLPFAPRPGQQANLPFLPNISINRKPANPPAALLHEMESSQGNQQELLHAETETEAGRTGISSEAERHFISEGSVTFPDEQPFHSLNTDVHRAAALGELEITEGDSVYWRVRAYDEENHGTWSIETWSAYAEIPDPPSSFHLSEPENGAVLQTLAPTLSWTQSSDIDHGDRLLYDLVWSMDMWTNADTIHGIVDTTFTFEDPELDGIEGADRFLESLVDLLREQNDGADPGFVNQAHVDWYVQAVDVTELRTSSDETFKFTLQDPHAPVEFSLSSPPDEYALEPEDSTVIFSWTHSFDPDDMGDLEYIFRMANNDRFENTFETVLHDTIFQFNRDDFRWVDATYYWYVEAMDATGSCTASPVWSFEVPYWTTAAEVRGLPTELTVSAAYPNPFNPTLSVEIAVPERESLRLDLLNLLGQRVAEWGPKNLEAGYHRVVLNLVDKPSGTYFLRLSTRDKVITVRKTMLLK